jgi:hypothetical protein
VGGMAQDQSAAVGGDVQEGADGFRFQHMTKCGSGLAREGGLSAEVDVECAGLIASRLAPTLNLRCTPMLRMTSINCGSQPAGDGGICLTRAFNGC